MERRQFNRILFDANAQLRQGTQTWSATIIDLSLKGALLEFQSLDLPDANQPLELNFVLQGSESTIRMQGHISHKEKHRAGFSCTDLDIDSITELRRLIQLNLANEALLQRDLHALVS